MKKAAANDKPEVEAPKAKAPKPAPVKLTPTQVAANRKEGMRLFSLAGRPSHDVMKQLFDPKGVSMTWTARAEYLGVATTDEAARPASQASDGGSLNRSNLCPHWVLW